MVGISNIPLGRIAKLTGSGDPDMYVARFAPKEVLRIWWYYVAI